MYLVEVWRVPEKSGEYGYPKPARPLENALVPRTLNYRVGLPETRPNLKRPTRHQWW